MTDSLWRKRQEPEALKQMLEAITQYLAESPDPSEEAVEGLCDAASAARKALAQPERSMKVEGPLHVVCQCDQCKAQPEQCPGCEGKPSNLNNPCAVCGKSQPEQELDGIVLIAGKQFKHVSYLYTTPPQRKPLTDWEIWDLHIKMSAAIDCKLSDLIELTRAVEAVHSIKE